MNVYLPEGLKDLQLNVQARKFAKDISGKDFEHCSDTIRAKSYELAIQYQSVIMTANIAASMEELIEAINNKE